MKTVPEALPATPVKPTGERVVQATTRATASPPPTPARLPSFARTASITLVLLGIALLYIVIPLSRRYLYRVDTARYAIRAAFLLLMTGLLLLTLYVVADILWAFTVARQ